MKPSKEYISTTALAKRWDMHAGTLKNWRSQKKGPPYYKFGHDVYYKLTDVISFERKTKPTKVCI
jgi:hypothetical protein